MSNIFTSPEKKYFSTEGALEFLETFASISMSKSRFYVLVSEGVIPVRKGPGGRLLIPIDAFRQWIEGNSEKVEA
jgi:hypothetical protein